MNVLARNNDQYEAADVIDTATSAAVIDRRSSGLFPPHDMRAPMLEAQDTVAVVLATVITLGPLLAYAVGLGA
jgi:hypothetical protein